MTSAAAQKAWETRRARDSGKSHDASERGAGVCPELWIEEAGTRLSVAIRFALDGARAPDEQLSETDRALRDLRLFAWNDLNMTPALFGYDVLRLDGYNATVETLERVLPAMRRVDRFLAAVRKESEDDSFAKAVESLAAHMRVTRVVHVRDGVETETKRGAAYITAHKIAESFLALHRPEIRDAA